MIDFEDQLEELGEDFGFLNTPAFVTHKWNELRVQWEHLVEPYAGIGNGTINPPNYLKSQYQIFRHAYSQYDNAWLPWTSGISVWRDEAARYTRVYKYLQGLRARVAGTPNTSPQTMALTPDPASSGAQPPSELYNPPPPDNDSNDSNGGSGPLFAGLNINIGTIAVLSIAGLFAYNVFFRLREGKKRV
jgi:hypothetical protein